MRTEEYRLHWGRCPRGHETRAALPEGVPTGAFGPRLVAAVGLLTGLYRLSKRNARRLFAELFGVEISEATISTCEHRISEALAEPHRKLHRHIKRVGLVHADETVLARAQRELLALGCLHDRGGLLPRAGSANRRRRQEAAR